MRNSNIVKISTSDNNNNNKFYIKIRMAIAPLSDDVSTMKYEQVVFNYQVQRHPGAVLCVRCQAFYTSVT